MKIATSDCASIAAIILGLASVYSRALGLSSVAQGILGMSAALFLVLTVVLRRREAASAASRDSERSYTPAFAKSRVGLVCGVIAVIAFLLGLCFDLLKR
jgi:hypothetical protein